MNFRLPHAWGLYLGGALSVLPMVLTLALTGKNEDRVPGGEVMQIEERPAERLEIEIVADPTPITPETPLESEEKRQIPEPRVIAEKSQKPTAGAADFVPIFAGFEHPRFQMHDELIVKCVAAFNAHRATWAGSTDAQAREIAPITAAQVKSQMIQESGGANALSRAAWRKDPLQANVPGDWSSYKKYVGLHRPRNRNEGSLEANIKAGIMILARKGFSPSAQPAANRPATRFAGWRQALRRYNGRSDLTSSGVPYRDVYASRILQRAAKPKVYHKIPIKDKTRRKRK